VLIACRTPLALATQTPDGPALWTGGTPWTRVPAPPGRLEEALVDNGLTAGLAGGGSVRQAGFQALHDAIGVLAEAA
jgi:hypothetical protein